MAQGSTESICTQRMSLGHIKGGIAFLRGDWDARTADEAYLILVENPRRGDDYQSPSGHTVLAVVPRDDEVAGLAVDLLEEAFPGLKGRFIYRLTEKQGGQDAANPLHFNPLL